MPARITPTRRLTEGDLLRQDIQANPEDDAVRLIYADWLEDNGNPIYAEFIRVQIELYQMEESPHDTVVSHLSLRGFETPKEGCQCRPCQLRRRERCAWQAKEDYNFVIAPIEPNGSMLGDYISSENHGGQSVIIWRRGFPHTVVCGWETWQNWHRTLVSNHPICAVRIHDKSPAVWNRVIEGDGWTWYIGDASAETANDYVTNAIWREMKKTWFATREEAKTAFHEAVLSLARKEAQCQPG